MSKGTSMHSEGAKIRELSLDEIEATADAGFFSWLRRIFGGDDPKPARGDGPTGIHRCRNAHKRRSSRSLQGWPRIWRDGWEAPLKGQRWCLPLPDQGEGKDSPLNFIAKIWWALEGSNL